MNRKGATPDLVHITPVKHTALVEPWTPTANLKMLISAASPDIRDREMKKVLFRPIENERDKPPSPDAEVEESCQVFETSDYQPGSIVCSVLNSDDNEGGMFFMCLSSLKLQKKRKTLTKNPAGSRKVWVFCARSSWPSTPITHHQTTPSGSHWTKWRPVLVRD